MPMHGLQLIVVVGAAAAFMKDNTLRCTIQCRGTFRDAQHELMDGGAALELAGDALLADVQGMDFIQANLAIRQPRGVAGVAIKNAGRAIADVGAKAAYAVDEAGVYFGGAEPCGHQRSSIAMTLSSARWRGD